MAIVPLKQRVTVHKPSETNDWGETTPGAIVEYKCRADEKTEIIKNQHGVEVVSSVQIMFDKLPDIAYNDVIEYTNELDVTVKRKPEKIEPIRMPNGKPTLTMVYL